MTNRLDFIDVPGPLHIVRGRWKAFSRGLDDSVRDQAYFIPASGRCFVALLPAKEAELQVRSGPRLWFLHRRRDEVLEMFAKFLDETTRDRVSISQR